MSSYALKSSYKSLTNYRVFSLLYRQELVNIGFCLGSFIFACPVMFLHGQGIGEMSEMSLVNLIGVLEKAVEPDTTCGNIRYVTEVIIPMTFRYCYS